MQLTADTGLTMAAYTAEPGSKSEEALNLLASCELSSSLAVDEATTTTDRP